MDKITNKEAVNEMLSEKLKRGECTCDNKFDESTAYQWAGQALRGCATAHTCADRVASALLEAYRLGLQKKPARTAKYRSHDCALNVDMAGKCFVCGATVKT